MIIVHLSSIAYGSFSVIDKITEIQEAVILDII